MATGKTTVGRLVATLLGRPFIDLDARIEEVVGMSIREIFASQGEARFRELESQLLEEIAGGSGAVVATGGGAPCRERNMARMRASGLVVALTAPLAELESRVDDPTSRPLWMRPAEEVSALYERRVSTYRQAHTSVRTEGATPEAVAEEVVGLWNVAGSIPDHALPHAGVVALSERAYPIVVAAGTLPQLGQLCRSVLGERCRHVAVISDDNVAPIYGARAREALLGADFAVSESVVPAGEGAKTFAHFARLAEALVAAGLDRQSAIIALGGGVVGDLAGFVAATLFRGIALVQVPTTVLAMVDSSIGGKTAINLEGGKNLVGAFWQPRLVLADPSVLDTLPVRERRAAFGELFKYALLDGEDLFTAVAGLRPETLEATERLTEVIRRCAAVKSWIVSRDEREQTGERALLNLGHTVGHAIEAAAGYGQLLHGEAVALGLIAACRVSAELGLAESELERRVTEALAGVGLDVDVDSWLREDVVRRIGVDKKRAGKTLGFITPKAVGRCVRSELGMGKLTRILRQ